ncbi:anthrax toxin-like adenylyl cyclase domain-containing protein [Hafnia alvei]|uniref:Toxin LF subunit n=2 Tax=Hafnia alvei TaxID=569 RepID=A0A1C6YYJ4_HAFAL|nr:anthrax toxin-like adenylyl cyclase domain-containing protein [Hafnia alvei]SCM51908.1 toxin LF subunit [Hafnia alvei]
MNSLNTPMAPSRRIESNTVINSIKDNSIIIKNSTPLESGIPFKMIDNIQKYLNVGNRKIVLAIRNVEKEAGTFLASEKKYPTKNFHIKGKSSNWGPQAGLIPVDQRFSKLRIKKGVSDEEIKKYSQQVQECIDKHYAVATPLRVTYQEIQKIGGKVNEAHGFTWTAPSASAEIKIDFKECPDIAGVYECFENDVKIEILSYPRDWENKISNDSYNVITSFLRSNYIERVVFENYADAYKFNIGNEVSIVHLKKSQDGVIVNRDLLHAVGKLPNCRVDGNVLNVDGKKIDLTPCMTSLPITADLDIFGIYSDAATIEEQDDKESLYPQRELAESPRQINHAKIAQSESVNCGNITVECLKTALGINHMLGQDVIHHSTEANNPYAGGTLDNLPAMFILSKMVQDKMSKSHSELSSFFESDVKAIILKDHQTVNYLVRFLSEAGITGAWNPSWNQSCDIPLTPVGGHYNGSQQLLIGDPSHMLKNMARKINKD